MGLTYIQLGTWNIKHLGQQPTEGERSQSVYALADHIEMAGIDVLALQEIYVTKMVDGKRSNEHLDKTCELLMEHTAADWKYSILENRDPEDTSQLCGVLWNNSILELVESIPIPVNHKIGNDWLWDRKPHAVKFKTREPILNKNRNFVLIPLHMKANGRDSRAKQKRKLEAEQLAQQIPWVINKMDDESIVLLGDTNILGSWEDASESLIDAGFDDLNAEDDATYAGSKAPFDRFYVKSERPEFKYSRQYVLKSASVSSHERFLSDHYLIKTSIKIYVDPS